MDRRENIIEVVCQMIARASNTKVMLGSVDLIRVLFTLANVMILHGVLYHPIVGLAGVLLIASLSIYMYKETIYLADALQDLSPDQKRRFVDFMDGSLQGMRFDDLISTCNNLTRDPKTIPRLLRNMIEFVKRENEA